MRRLAITFVAGLVLGIAAPVVTALYLGGESIAQAGIRLSAIEQGFALAGRHWQFDATPAHEVVQVAQADEQPVAKKPAKRR